MFRKHSRNYLYFALINVLAIGLLAIQWGYPGLTHARVNMLNAPDLVVDLVDHSSVTGDWQTLVISGTVSAEVTNQGDLSVLGDFDVTFFEDANSNGVFDSGVDTVLGTATQSGLANGATAVINGAVSGTVAFRDNLIYAFVDSGDVVAESDEGNNYSNTGLQCSFVPPVASFNPVVKFQAQRGLNVISTPMVANLTDDNSDSVIDENDIPDMVFATLPTAQFSGGAIKAISGDDGSELFTAGAPNLIATLSELGVGDIDLDGLPEIIGAHRDGQHLIAFEHDGTFKWLSDTDVLPGRADSGGAISIANLDGTGNPEIIVGPSVYSASGALIGDGRDLGGFRAFNVFSSISSVADIDLDGTPEVIAGATAYRLASGALTRVWHRADVGDGFVGIANFDSDPFAEVVIVGNGRVSMLNHDGTNAEIWNPPTNTFVTLPGGGEGGAPTIADYDNDGLLEIGIAGASRYVVFNSDASVLWTTTTQDFSSRTTGSTPFDFDGDGSVEVVYRDEQFLRIYRGTDGFVLYQLPMRSGTATELPVVADVDNDGNAEIAVSSDRLFGGTLDDTGVYVIEDAADTWVNTRTIWNQHSYHITNINDDATVPLVESNNWETFNNYRQNLPIAASVFASPDLTASFVQITQDATNAFVTARIGNGGAILVASGVPISFYDGDPSLGGTLLGIVNTSTSLLPGQFEDVTLTLPKSTITTNSVWVSADDSGGLVGQTNECDETNNIHDSGLTLPPNNLPVADANGPYVGDEGSNIALDGSGSSDPDGTITLYEWDLDNDGQFDDATGVNTSVSFPDNGNFVVGLQVTDDDGAVDSDTANVTVNNVAPTVDAGPGQPVNLGDVVTLEINISDPGVNDGPWGLFIDWDDGDTDSGLITTQLVPTFAQHQYSSPGTFDVQICVTDKDGDTDCDDVVVTVTGSGSLTPRQLKQRAIDTLEQHIPDPIVTSGQEGFNLAQSKIIDSIDPDLDLWLDDFHVKPDGGLLVFELERGAAIELTDVLTLLPNLSQDMRDAGESALADIVAADRILADTKIQDVESGVTLDPGNQSQVDALIGLAKQSLADGDAARASGDDVLAIDGYTIAWEHAIAAMNLQMQAP